MNGNVSKEGVRLDLKWMQRVGIGGVQNFDASFGAPNVVPERIAFMTQPWIDAIRSAVKLADQFGMEFAIASAPGWSATGGPWVVPSQGMKKLVWSEVRVVGGKPGKVRLQEPPRVVGPYQNVPWLNPMVGGPGTKDPVPELYTDVAVIAYRVPDEDRLPEELHPVVTSSAGSIDATLLWDDDYTKTVNLPFGPEGQPAWIQWEFRDLQRVQSISLGLEGNSYFARSHVAAELQSSVDGRKFRKVVSLYNTSDVVQTVTFAPTRARYFRLVLPTPPSLEIPPAFAPYVGPAQIDHRISEFVLYTAPRVDHFERKAGFFIDDGSDRDRSLHLTRRDVIASNQVLNLTERLHKDGTLEWVPPPGRWAVLRIGYSLLGTTNHPASAEATGLEVDKLSRASVKAYMDAYLSRYEAALGPRLIGQHGLRAMVTDSWEAGAQNWTEELPLEFARRRGYDIWPWLPALCGRIVGSLQSTERFLWDFRRTLGELLTENYFSQMTTSLHERGLIRYGESHEVGRAFIGDGMDAKRSSDVPMGAMWANEEFTSQKQGDADLRESASVAHIYGQNVVAAESMTVVGGPTNAFAFAPADLKQTADREMADGVNRFVLHTSVHQPLVDKAPGLTLGPFGQWFTRNETWAEQAAPWITYLARSSYLLQQGHFVADVIYYYGEDSNITSLYGNALPPVPEGYAYDFANRDALMTLSVQGGLLVTNSGMQYRVLALDPRSTRMSLDVLKRIAGLVTKGATVVGQEPHETPSLADNDDEFHALADAVWGRSGQSSHRYGDGVVLSNRNLGEAIADMKIEPDFSYAKRDQNSAIWFVHRRVGDIDLYFINNRQGHTEDIEARFRVVGRAPELWHADTGRVEPASFRQEGEHTIVPLKLDEHDAVFVVFCKPATTHARAVASSVREPLGVVRGPWTVHFQSGRGAPEQVAYPELKSWTESSDPGVKYFSGTATYDCTLSADKSWMMNGQKVELDLGRVRDVAEVLINGNSAGIVWKSPYRVDITEFLRDGINKLAVRVTNLWANRLIGDKQPNAKPIGFTTYNPYDANSPLRDSGLLGPVILLNVGARRADSR